MRQATVIVSLTFYGISAAFFTVGIYGIFHNDTMYTVNPGTPAGLLLGGFFASIPTVGLLDRKRQQVRLR